MASTMRWDGLKEFREAPGNFKFCDPKLLVTHCPPTVNGS